MWIGIGRGFCYGQPRPHLRGALDEDIATIVHVDLRSSPREPYRCPLAHCAEAPALASVTVLVLVVVVVVVSSVFRRCSGSRRAASPMVSQSSPENPEKTAAFSVAFLQRLAGVARSGCCVGAGPIC